jgi:hypothetical protein
MPKLFFGAVFTLVLGKGCAIQGLLGGTTGVYGLTGWTLWD